MRELRLEEPSVALLDSYRELVREFIVHGETLIPFVLAFDTADGPAFVDHLAACARGDGLPEGFVPHSTHWLVRDGREVVGVSNFRHALTDNLRREGGHIGYGVRPSARRQGVATELLRQTLERAREHGLGEVLVTCAKTNTGSVRTILRNGGQFVSEQFIAERGEVVQVYRIAMGEALPRGRHAFHIAQVNVARMKAPLDSETMAGFVARLADINALSDASPGFVWRLQDDAGDATSLRAFDDERILFNLSVWESPENLQAFVYRSAHTEVMRQRNSWFERFEGFYYALWWVPAGHVPSVDEAKARLEHLQARGETPQAFTFARLFPEPQPAVAAAT